MKRTEGAIETTAVDSKADMKDDGKEMEIMVHIATASGDASSAVSLP